MTLTDLITKLERTTEPDRWLDAKIDAAMRIGTVKMQTGGFEWAWDNFPVWAHHKQASGMCGVQTTNGDLGLIWDSLPFTASTDAAVALAERVLPGKWPGILRSALSDLGNRNDWHICLVRPDQIRALPTAIVLATLRALQAKENGR